MLCGSKMPSINTFINGGGWPHAKIFYLLLHTIYDHFILVKSFELETYIDKYHFSIGYLVLAVNDFKSMMMMMMMMVMMMMMMMIKYLIYKLKKMGRRSLFCGSTWWLEVIVKHCYKKLDIVVIIDPPHASSLKNFVSEL